MNAIRGLIEIGRAKFLGLSNEQALEFFLENFAKSPPEFSSEEKNEDAADMFLEIATRALKQGSYPEALQNYNKSLRMSIPYSQTTAICLVSRSLALFKLQAYEESMADVDRALQFPNIDAWKKELIDRKEKLKKIIKNRSAQIKAMPEHDKPFEDIQLARGESDEIPGASKSITIAHNRQFGRLIVATEPIKAGDVLLVQKPYFAYFVQTMGNPESCHHCLKECMAPIPCDFCTSAVYCSEKCRQEAYDKYHRIECKLSGNEMPIDNFQSMGHRLFLRAIMVVTDQGKALSNVMKEMEEIKNCKDARKSGFTGDQFLGCSSKALLSLLGHLDKNDDTIGLIYSSAMIAVLLRNHTDFFQGNVIDVLDVAKLCIRIISIFRMNVVMIRRGGITDVVAQSMYPVFNLLNHSCVNNTIAYTYKDNARVLRAFRDIEPGEQVFTNYINDQTIIFNAEKRRELLLKYKFFVCHCQACDYKYTFRPELKGKLRVPQKLQRKLRQNPIRIECMWELLQIMLREINQPCLEVEIMKFGLMDAYMGNKTDGLLLMYRNIGIM